MKWQQYFSPTIRQRGRRYFNQNQVSELNYGTGQVDAIVQGSEEYHVHMEFSPELKVKKMTCDCPYWTECKHEVAVFLLLDAIGDADLKASLFETQDLQALQLYVLLQEVAPQDRLDFLAETLAADPNLLLTFKQRFGLPLSEEELRNYGDKFEDLLRSLMTAKTGQEGFFQDFLAFIQTELPGLTRQAPKFCERLSFQALQVLDRINAWPNEYYQATCLHALTALWEKLLEHPAKGQKREIFEQVLNWLEFHLTGDAVQTMGDFLLANYPQRTYQRNLQHFADSLEEKKDEADDQTEDHLITFQLTIEVNQLFNVQAILQIVRNHHNLASLVSHAAKRLYQLGEQKQALLLLREGKYAQPTGSKQQVELSQELGKAYQQAGQQQNYLKELLLRVTQYQPGDLMDYRALEQVYQRRRREWEQVQNALLEALPAEQKNNLLQQIKGGASHGDKF